MVGLRGGRFEDEPSRVTSGGRHLSRANGANPPSADLGTLRWPYGPRVVPMEGSPSPVYGARLESVYGVLPHRGFKSPTLRQPTNAPGHVPGAFFVFALFATRAPWVLP